MREASRIEDLFLAPYGIVANPPLLCSSLSCATCS